MHLSETPFVSAICPTFRHPELLANSLALWIRQSYPRSRRKLVILDDDPTFVEQHDGDFSLHVATPRLPTISAKYNHLLELVPKETEIVLVWEDDDVYFQHYVHSHVETMREEKTPYSKPSRVLTDYPGHVIEEGAVGRFHSSQAFTKDLIQKVGGWPDTRRADFDQQLMAKLIRQAGDAADPCKHFPNQFLYRWHSGSAHCQSTMRSPDDETWYERGEDAYKKVPFVGALIPKLDEFTSQLIKEYDA